MKRLLKLSTSHIIMLSFLLTTLLGGILLTLPISSASGVSVPFTDSLFTATSAICVTGLVTLPPVVTWSFFGEMVILALIQIGGLGTITIMSGVMIALRRRIGFGQRLMLQDAFNLNSLSGLVRFVKKVFRGTFLVEAAGALIYMLVFVPDFGLKGIWFSIFNSVSAFCNAGIDIISENSLCDYATNPIINAVTCTLIVLGGLGYIVWWDVINVLKKWKKLKFKCLRHLSLHSKIAISATFFLIFSGAALILIFEYSNPLTIKDFSLYDKIQAAFFQSVTTRTAGFATLPQQNLTNPTVLICILLMFIGGSPVGTAGGVKTVTVTILLASALSVIKNRDEIILFSRNVIKNAVSKAVAVVSISFIIVFSSTVLLSLVTDAPAIDILYETVSATATVGLSRNLTAFLNVWGKYIIITTMYFGRIGPISLAVAFYIRRNKQNIVKNPTESVSVG